MSPDQDGKRIQTNFFEDSAETPAIYAIIPIVSGRNDESLVVSVKVKDVFGQPVSSVYKPFVIAQLAPGVQGKPLNVGVQFPDPPPIQVPNPADPTSPFTQPQLRAVGDYQVIATMNGDTQTTNFKILPASAAFQSEPDPNAGTPQQAPPPGACTDQTLGNCPQPTADQANNASAVACCTSDGNCGIGIRSTGLCSQRPFNQ